MIMTTKSLLVELFVEELPPKALKKLGESFAAEVYGHLDGNDFIESPTRPTAYASPRRLAVHITGVRSVSVPRPRPAKTLMPAAIGFDPTGKPTPPLVKRIHAMYSPDVDIEWLLRERIVVEEENGKQVIKHREDLAAGSPLAVALEGAIKRAIGILPIPKVMAYQLHENCDQPGWTTEHFVRPAHRLAVLHGDEVPQPEIIVLGLKAGAETQGHRFEADENPIVILNADSYADQLRDQGKVIASFAERRAAIVKQLNAAAAKEGLKPIEDEALLDEVTALVERPNVLTCQFEPEFLDVPQECLILTMKANQKYFPLLDAAGKLTNKFLVVSNIKPDDASAVIGGNERVVRPRLADAKFFFDQDRKKSLADRVPGLAKVIYHNKLGTQGERAQRVAAIASAIAQQLGGEKLSQQADQAALLSKADLLTDMVGEFPELQGIMGRYYALHDGLPVDIADAIEDHYNPKFAGDTLPRGQVGVCVALADKLETLVGMFGIGQVPTGDKDPFALRRHALGVLRMLIEQNVQLPLNELVNTAFDAFPPGMLGDAHTDLQTFVFERFAGLLREQGYSVQEVDAVLCMRPVRIDLVPKQLAAVRAFAALPEAASLAAANKRVGNILKKVSGGVTPKVDAALLREPAEAALNAALAEVKPKADRAFDRGDYTASLQSLAVLKAPVDQFFDDVMVNVEDDALRANRLGLLAILHQAMNRVADLSRLSA